MPHLRHSLMHDLYLANQIVKIAKDYARKNGLAKVTKIVIELGSIVEHGENISPENLKYNINLLMPCEVEIKRIKKDKWGVASIEAE